MGEPLRPGYLSKGFKQVFNEVLLFRLSHTDNSGQVAGTRVYDSNPGTGFAYESPLCDFALVKPAFLQNWGAQRIQTAC